MNKLHLYSQLWCLLVYSSSLTIGIKFFEEKINVTNYKTWVKLGGLFSLHHDKNNQCGELSNTAVERVEAMLYALGRINSNPSILPNITLTYDIRDTCSIPSEVLRQSLDFYQVFKARERSELAISGVIGAERSDSSILATSIFSLFQTPQISYGSTAATLSDKTKYKYFFRTIPSDVSQVKAIASLIRKFNWTYVFSFYSMDTYGRDGFNYLAEELARGNGSATTCLLLQTGIPLGISQDDIFFDKVVDQMNKQWISNSSVAVLFGHPEQAQGILGAIDRKLEVNATLPLDRITWIASDSWALSLDAKLLSRARGMLAVHPKSIIIPEFVNYFTNLTLNATPNPWFKRFWESAFQCSLFSNDSICNLETQRLPKNFTLTKLYPYVLSGVYAFALSLHNLINDYCSSNILCDEVLVTHSFGHAVNGALLRRYITSFGHAVNGALLRRYITNVSLAKVDLFKSEGKLFDSNGDVQISYTIFNLQTDLSNMYSFRPVGIWDHVHLLNINVSDIEWRSGSEVPQSVCSLPCGPGHESVSVPNQAQCCWTCRSCLGELSVSSGDGCFECREKFIPNSDKSNCTAIPHSYLSWSSSLGNIITALTALGVIICIGTGMVYAIFINDSLIKASSRELSAVLLGGIFLCYILPLVFLVKPTPASCAMQRLVSGLCFSIVYSALLVKINRIHRIFNRSVTASPQPRFVSPASQVIFAFLLMLIQLVIAAVWLIVEYPRVKTVLVNRRLLELVCDQNPHATLVVTIMYNVILLTASAFFAFRTRKVPERFNEAKFISVTVFSLCVLWLAFVPTFYILTTVRVGSKFYTFSLLITILLSASTTLCCLLIPRAILVIVFRMKKNVNTDIEVHITEFNNPSTLH